MFKNYLKVAVRTLMRNRLVSFINIFGLGLSMSVGMMVMIRLQDQLSYDHFHPHGDRTYRIISHYTKNSGEAFTLATTPLPVYNSLRGFTDIAEVVNLSSAYSGNAVANGKELPIGIAFTEPSFFRVFGFSLAAGDPGQVLEQPNSIVISKRTADRFFGQSGALGKVITLEPGNHFIVTGVMHEPPSKSHIVHDAYISNAARPQIITGRSALEKSEDPLNFMVSYTYVVLKEGYSEKGLENELKSVSASINKNNKEGSVLFDFQPLEKITPGTGLLANDNAGSSWTKFYIEMSVALIILLAACFNYTNLTVARALTRAKEVGVRKVNGASRAQVFLQYLTESLVLSLLSLGFAWILLSFIIRYAPFNDDYEFIPSTFHLNGTLVSWSVAFACFAGLIAGSSPAWILSSFKPLQVLGNLKNVKLFGKVGLQKILIVFQYSLSLTIIIFLFAFYKQFAHLASADPGFRRENVYVVPLDGLDEKIVAENINSIPGVRSSSAMSSAFSKHFGGLNMNAWLNDPREFVSLNYYFADEAFIRDMEIPVVAGRNLLSGDRGEEQYILLNEQAVKALGFPSSQAAVGKRLSINDSTKLEIVGVVKNFNYENAGKPIYPLAFRSRKNAYDYLYVSTDPVNKAEFNRQVKQVMMSLTHSSGFEGGWLDQELEESNSQAATLSLLGYLAFMAVAIATLGLLGLVIYTVEIKRKEIGIRKIIGARSGQLVQLLSSGFIKLLLIAGCIAIPVGYTAGFLFLHNFADRVSFGLGSAFLCFSLLLAIGLFTIISQTYKAAIQSPSRSLRAE